MVPRERFLFTGSRFRRVINTKGVVLFEWMVILTNFLNDAVFDYGGKASARYSLVLKARPAVHLQLMVLLHCQKTDSNPNPGTDILPKMCTVAIGDLSPDKHPIWVCVMTLSHSQTRTWPRTRTRNPVLRRNRKQGSQSTSMQCEHVLYCWM